MGQSYSHHGWASEIIPYPVFPLGRATTQHLRLPLSEWLSLQLFTKVTSCLNWKVAVVVTIILWSTFPRNRTEVSSFNLYHQQKLIILKNLNPLYHSGCRGRSVTEGEVLIGYLGSSLTPVHEHTCWEPYKRQVSEFIRFGRRYAPLRGWTLYIPTPQENLRNGWECEQDWNYVQTLTVFFWGKETETLSNQSFRNGNTLLENNGIFNS